MSTPTPPIVKPNPQELLPVFQDMLSIPATWELIRAACQTKRFYVRLFSPLVLIWCLIYQRLNPDHSCEAVVSYVASGGSDRLDTHHSQPLSQRLISTSSAAYCKARQRLSLAVLKAMVRHTTHLIRHWAGEAGSWMGHPVVLLDGTTFRLRPEPELVAAYGQSHNQHGPAYWVTLRAVVAFCLRTAAALGVVDGPATSSEQSLAAGLLAEMPPHSVCVGDRNFGVFSVAQACRHYDIWVVLRLTEPRACALAHRALRPGEDRRVDWSPSPHDHMHPDMSAAPIAGRLIAARLERPGFRPVVLYLFTTLLDADRYLVSALIHLYALRWHAELNLRYVKTTLDMAELTGKSVDIVRKELFAGLLAYTLIRAYMLRAAQQANLSPLTLSFARCWRHVRDTLSRIGASPATQPVADLIAGLLTRLALCRLPNRPRFRLEPRAVRRRPAVYPNLKGSRAAARQRLLEHLRAPVASLGDGDSGSVCESAACASRLLNLKC